MRQAGVILSLLFFLTGMVVWAENYKRENQYTMNNNEELATFAGGCFWCTEAIFDQVKGVKSVTSGYSGGHVINPSYREVTQGRTGHAEAIQLTCDPDVITYIELLEIFFKTHDPTTLNRQGADVGTQYRSAIFYHSEAQRKAAEEIIDALDREGIWNNPIVTEVTEFSNFYPAEAYHQEYFENNPNQGYCRIVIQPKVEKFKKVFEDKLK
ncbi:MAG: peptide-methionine (S)-S-oxide reductase MsrA [Bacteroidales bacterium]|nr:peptide-methionine (S)-S-oxide reductase MsrA [Bacteroidales bacterium]MDT8430879.1 peptide-methionine (S)-S-oxide reductase MsrA [Bacteroidales bacterium]